MIIYLCMKYESNTLIFSKDILPGNHFSYVRDVRTYVRTDKGDAICPPPHYKWQGHKKRKSTNKKHLALFQILQKYNTEFIQHIEDISDFVHEQKKILDKDKKHGEDHIQVAKETVYTVADEKLAAQIELDHFVPRQPVEPDEPVP